MTTGITAKRVVSFGGMILLFILIVGYGLWNARDVIFGAPFTVVGVTDGMSTTGSWLDISGSAPNANSLTIDSRTVPTALDGSWKDTIALLPGYNVITVGVTDKFNRTTTREYRVYYNAPEQPAAQPAEPSAPAAPANTPSSGTPATPATGNSPQSALPSSS